MARPARNPRWPRARRRPSGCCRSPASTIGRAISRRPPAPTTRPSRRPPLPAIAGWPRKRCGVSRSCAAGGRRTTRRGRLCARSEAVAREAGDEGLVAEALNTAGGIDLLDERFGEAGALFRQAEALATDPDLLGRVEQNLATVASTQGDYAEALDPLPALTRGVPPSRERARLRRRLPQPRRHQHRPPAMARRRSLPPSLPPRRAPHRATSTSAARP